MLDAVSKSAALAAVAREFLFEKQKELELEAGRTNKVDEQGSNLFDHQQVYQKHVTPDVGDIKNDDLQHVSCSNLPPTVEVELEQQHQLERYLHANCEALRKAAKKFDKHRGRSCQQLKVLSIEQALREVNYPKLDGDLHVSTQKSSSVVVPRVRRTLSSTSEEEEDDAPNGTAGKTTGKAIKSSWTAAAGQHYFRPAALIYNSLHYKNINLALVSSLLLLLLAAFQPFVVEWSKEGTNHVPYNPVSVILAESVCSVFLACFVSVIVVGSSCRTTTSTGSSSSTSGSSFLQQAELSSTSITTTARTPGASCCNSVSQAVYPCIAPSNVLKFLPTGVLRAVEDSLSIYALQYVAPTTYMVLLQSRLLLTGLAAQFLVPECTAPTRVQWHALFFTLSGIMAFKSVVLDQQEQKDDKDDSSSSKSKSDSLTGTVILAVAVVCKVGASIWAERALKRGADTSVIVQAANISCGTVVASLVLFPIGQAVFPPVGKDSPSEGDDEKDDGSSSSNNASFSNLFANWSLVTLFLVFYLLQKNWVSTVVVKKLSATTKYVVYAIAIVLTYFLELLFIEGYQMQKCLGLEECMFVMLVSHDS